LFIWSSYRGADGAAPLWPGSPSAPCFLSRERGPAEEDDSS